MESETPKTTVNNLIETANKNGGIDNIGVAVCEVVPRGK
jgi:serine/threonine protein phosphatase PrpC